MKTIELSDSLPNLKEVLELAGKENIILRTLDGREFVLAEVDDFNKEIELIRQNQELLKLLDQRSEERKTFTLNQVRKQLNLK